MRGAIRPRILTFRLADPTLREMARIDHGDGWYYRTPRWGRTAAGTPVLFAIGWDAQGEAVVRFQRDGSDRKIVERRDAIAGLVRQDGPPTVAEDSAHVDTARRAGWSVRIERKNGRSRVIANDVVIFDAFGTAAAPTVAPAPGGAWVAFHHNVREDTGEPDLVKWIALRFITDDAEVFEPEASMTDRDRDRQGEEQGFEYPELVVGEDGALALFGRGSHAFFRQDLNAEGFSSRRALGEVGWGCRGRWVSALVDDGRVLLARRVKGGIAIDEAPLPTGEAPALRAARVVLPTKPHRDVPPRPTGPDPAARDGRRTLFGDIHQHSAHSDGCGAADEPYLRARYVYGDDFGALTDHESFIGKRIGPGEWRYLCDVADRHDEPGRFATLIAYEWTGRRFPGPGHKVVYMPEAGGEIVSRDDVREGADLIARIKALGGFAVPHHVGWTGANEEAHDPEGQPVWEICSCHGCYLSADHPLGSRGSDLLDQMVDAVMARGRRFGFIACSDGHGLLFHHGVGRKRDPFRCGLTAVQAKDCTRPAILSAIRERRCYATSGVPILLDLRVAGAPMGAEIQADGPVEARAIARCASPIASIVLIGPDGAIASSAGDGAHALSVEGRVPHGWVYARVLQEDGEMAWSSPVFIDPRG